jgi:hypothetical protein
MKPIYLYHLIQNGRVRYVGITTDITRRKSTHKRERPPHTFEIIETFSDKEQAGIAEQYHIAGHNTFKGGWNNSIGGEKLLTGDKHPSWTDGLSLLDRKTYMKKYGQTPQRKSYIKEYQQTSPVYKAYKKEYTKEYWQRPEVKEKDRKRSKERYQRKKHPIFDLFSGAFI